MGACTTCTKPQVERINALLASGTPVRALARMESIPRSNLARHAQHVPPADRPLGLIPPLPIEDPRLDPLEEGLRLLERATTERQTLRALEAIRAATALRIKEMGTPDNELLEQIDANIEQAKRTYRAGSDSFDHAIRGLQGIREAVRQKIDAVSSRETIQARLAVQGSDGTPRGESPEFSMPMSLYFEGVPQRFHNLERFRVERTVQLSLGPPGGGNSIKVRDAEGVLVWSSERQAG